MSEDNFIFLIIIVCIAFCFIISRICKCIEILKDKRTVDDKETITKTIIELGGEDNDTSSKA